jgi:hypothetical protein
LLPDEFSQHFPSLSCAINLLIAIEANPNFISDKPSDEFIVFLERLENADPNAPDLSDDDSNAGWGHYQYTAGGLTISTMLVSLKSIGSSEMALKLLAAALKTCKVARHVCFERNLDPSSFISDTYLQILVEKVWDLWTEAGGVCINHLFPAFPL